MATKYYFTKVRGLATVIWNSKKNRSLAEFDKQGLFETTDRDLAQQLLDAGYRQVTADQITQAGLMLPDDFANMRARQAGKGYQNTPVNEETPDEPKLTVAQLFEPVPPAAGKRKLID